MKLVSNSTGIASFVNLPNKVLGRLVSLANGRGHAKSPILLPSCFQLCDHSLFPKEGPEFCFLRGQYKPFLTYEPVSDQTPLLENTDIHLKKTNKPSQKKPPSVNFLTGLAFVASMLVKKNHPNNIISWRKYQSPNSERSLLSSFEHLEVDSPQSYLKGWCSP